MENINKEMQIGKAGEYLVCADLCKMGLIAYPSEQGLPYDVVIDVNGKLLKCQVKTTLKPVKMPQRASNIMSYLFHVKRKGKDGKKRYSENEVDVFALVALDEMIVGYIKNDKMPETLSLRCEKHRGLYHDEKGIIDYGIVKGLKSSGCSNKIISEKTGMHYTAVCRMLKEGYEPFKTKAKYLSELSKSIGWFNEIHNI